MKRSRITVITAYLLIALTLFSCSPSAAPVEVAEVVEVTDNTEPVPTDSVRHVAIGNNLFTLRYDPDSSLNPFTCDNADNLLITQLLYEGLFVLDNSFTPHPVLCESIETEDNLVYRLTIKPDIAMSDGETLTAGDVAYTLNAARTRGRFVNRLSSIEDVSTADGLTVIITLRSPNAHFTKLLDIPIIKSGTIDYRVPPGTGPYSYIGGDSLYLLRTEGYRDYSSLPISSIYLAECGSSQLIEQFSDGLIDLLWDDPTDSSVFESNRQHDVRTYNTATLQFIGFNTRTEALNIPEIRRALSLAVDRTYITDEIMNGYALSSPLAFSPAYENYSSSWDKSGGDKLLLMSELISSAGFADENNDSYLEYPVPGVGYTSFSIDFIVNSENPFKTRTAQHIAETLRRIGFDIIVRELTWSAYVSALNTGDFDMYLGDVALSADFDLSPLLLPGGRLDYGNIGDSVYEPYLSAYFSAGSPAAEAVAARQLCDLIYENVPFIPVSYKKHAVRSCRGVVSGAAPSQSSVFFGITNWTIVPGEDVRTLPAGTS